ncbi:MAG: glycosyltransferase [Alphaproteobacteria bacterium]
MKIAFYGSSLLSSYWNGAATYYRGLIRALACRGHDLAFFEPRAFDRQLNADMEPPEWCEVVVYEPDSDGLRHVLAKARCFDVVVKTSGVGVLDTELLEGLQRGIAPHALYIFWDVDAPATQAEIANEQDHPLRRILPKLDMVVTYGGGPPVERRYREFGACRCNAIYNGLDPETHHPAAPAQAFAADLSFLGNRLPDREARVDAFFFDAARSAPEKNFLIGGSGWNGKSVPPNVRWIGHVSTRDHNVFNATPRAVLNIARESMALVGYSPATRVFEAAGAGACLVSDQWDGMELFLKPEEEVLLARDGQDVAEIVRHLTAERAHEIGQAALRRVLADHTYDKRAETVEKLLVSAYAARQVA